MDGREKTGTYPCACAYRQGGMLLGVREAYPCATSTLPLHYEAQFDLNGELIVGSMPRKQTRLISAWVELHRDELAANWELAKQDQPLYKIDPLR